jgi:hypothetical protein
MSTPCSLAAVFDSSDPPPCSGEMANHTGLDVALPEPLVVMGSWCRLHRSIDERLWTRGLRIGSFAPLWDELIQAARDSREVAVLNGVMIRRVHAHRTNDERPKRRVRVSGPHRAGFPDELSRREDGHPAVGQRSCRRQEVLARPHPHIVLHDRSAELRGPAIDPTSRVGASDDRSARTY